MLRATYRAVKRAHPAARLVIGDPVAGCDSTRWLERVLTLAPRSFDIANLHLRGRLRHVRGELRRWRAVYARHGRGRAPVWVTEFGYSSTNDCQPDPATAAASGRRRATCATVSTVSRRRAAQVFADPPRQPRRLLALRASRASPFSRRTRRGTSLPSARSGAGVRANSGAVSAAGAQRRGFPAYARARMAKDTEKLIRQLSLISFLMAERRPVTALEIKQDVEGYSQMNDDAFARRFYADRAELESLGIELKVDKPAEGYYEAENYSLPPENFYLPAIEFTDQELGALRTALSLLDGEFAYAEPLRLALQQLSWGKPSPLDAPEQRSVALAVTAGAGGRELSQRLSKIETAIFRRKTIVFDYYTIGRDAAGEAQGRPLPPALPRRAVLPGRPLARARRRPRVPAVAHPRQGRLRVEGRARLHARPRTSTRASTPRAPTGSSATPWARARIWISDRIDWLVLRHFGHAGEVSDGRATTPGDGIVFETDYAEPRQLISWVLGLGPARADPRPARAGRRRPRERTALVIERHSSEPELELAQARAGASPSRERSTTNGKRESPIRPERFARLVTLAGILIEAAREAQQARRARAVRVAPGRPSRSCARTSTCSTS